MRKPDLVSSVEPPRLMSSAEDDNLRQRRWRLTSAVRDRWLTKLPSYIEEVSPYSDTYSGQNRNQQMVKMRLSLLQDPSNNMEFISHNFLKSD
ncbi:hypothetical protein RRG08_001491 [Elysia crispata]|uniref:Uncharacterized protein n=1 Tax=Elysia crispata TaxID=231223 RepID=A0AAE1ACK0_9GAST|nr:hypothetical protein RRG08_001491 [Elysia crispata]